MSIDKDKVEALLAVSQKHRDRLEKRRGFEWKFFWALWTAIGTFAIALATEKMRLPSWGCHVFVVASAAIAVACVVWMHGVQKHNRADTQLARFYLDAASFLVIKRPQRTVTVDDMNATALDGDLASLNNGAPQPKSWVYAVIPQAIVTLVLLSLTCFLAWSSARSTKDADHTIKMEYTTSQPPKKIEGNISN